MHTSLTLQTTLKQPSLNTREFCIVKGMTEDITNPLTDPFFTRRMKLLSRPDGFMLYGKLGIDLFSTSELLYPNLKIRLRLIRARLNFNMISDKPNVSLGIVDCSLYTRRIALKDDYHKKRMDMLAFTPVEYNSLETLAKTFIILANQNQFFQETIFNNAPIRRVAIAMKTNSAFTGSFTVNPFWYQQIDLRQIKILRGGQPIVDFDTADNCCLYVTTMKALNFRDYIPSIPVDDLKDHYVLVFDLTSMQDNTENCHYPELVGEPLRLELNFTNPLENVTELIVWGERMSSVAVDKFGVVGKNVSKWIFLLSNNLSIVSLCWNFDTSVRSPQTMFQLLTMTLLLLSSRSTAICRVNIGSWLQISDMNCILQTLLDVKVTVFSTATTSTTSRWCQHPYSLTQVCAAFIQYLQLFICSGFSRKKLQGFTMVMYFHSLVITCNNWISLM